MASQSNDKQDTTTPVDGPNSTIPVSEAPAFEEVTGLSSADFADAFDEAKEAVVRAPDSEEAWNRLDQLGKLTGRVDDVAATYSQVLDQDLDAALMEKLAKRALTFLDEWIDDQDLVKRLLLRTLEVSPTAAWALERVSVLLTIDSDWERLLSCYDRAIEACEADEDRIAFLEEAASVAKDLAGETSRAIQYLEKLFELQPSERHVISSLERLYRYEKRFEELVNFWKRLIPVSNEKTQGELKVKIAICWLEDLQNAGKALEMAEELLDSPATFDKAVELLGNIIASDLADAATRKAAIDLLGKRLDDSDDWHRVVDAIDLALPRVDAEQALGLRGEIIRRLAQHDDTQGVIDHLAVLVAFQPERWGETQVAKLLEGKVEEQMFGVAFELEEQQAHSLVHEAAHIALEQAKDWDRAVELYQQILAFRADDLEAIEQLSRLYAEANRSNDLLALRQHELSLEENQERRLQLRLEVASLLQTLQRSDDASEELRHNLEEVPGHRPSVEALSRILRNRERFEELAAMLSEQASVVQEKGDDYEAANLWMQAARVADEKLQDQVKALDYYARVVALQPNTNALDALARIHEERNEPELAVRWLEKRLDLSTEEDREETVVRLARAYWGSDRVDKAIELLRAEIEKHPSSGALRERLAEIYRERQAWTKLVELLLEGAEHAEDDSARFQYLKDAAHVYQHELGKAEEAIPVLQRAVKISPADRTVRADLADALRAAGRLEEARQLAEGLIEEFGRRHPPERAQLHLLLARVMQSEGNTEGAIRELEQAATMDVGNVAVRHMLASLYLSSGQLDAAEKTYRALLLLLRRNRMRRDADGKSAAVDAGVAETLFELYRIASQRGDSSLAEENLASEFDAAARNLDEAIRFERAIRRANDMELLQRALRQRLDLASTPIERAGILTDMSALLAESLGRPEEALQALLDAIEEAPDNTEVFTRARNLAKTLDALAPLVQRLEKLAEEAEQEGQTELACTLYLRLETIESQDRHNLPRAKELLDQANATQVLHDRVWMAQAALAREMKDEEWERDALENILTLGDKEISPSDRLEAQARLVELQLQHENSLEQGIETMREALEQGWSVEQAMNLLERQLEVFPSSSAICEQLESLARQAGDDRRLLGVLHHRCVNFQVEQDVVKEAVRLCEKLGDTERERELLQRAVQLAEAQDGELGAAKWAVERLAEQSKEQEQWNEAVQWLTKAADLAEKDKQQALLVEAATIAWKKLQDLSTAENILEGLLEKDPSNEAAWRPMMELLEEKGDNEKLVELLSKTAESVEDQETRIALRTKRAGLLLDMPGHADEAIEELDKILQEAPDNADAADLSIRVLREQNRTDELEDLLRRQLELAHDRGQEQRGADLAHQLAELVANRSPEEALAVYRSSVTWTARHEAFLRGYVALLQSDEQAQERAQVLERLLLDESIPDAADLVLDLVEAREIEGDLEKLETALEQAYAIAPDNTRTLSYFEAFAEQLQQAAQNESDPQAAVDTYVKAANIYTTRLNDPESAAEALGKASELKPNDDELLMRLVDALLEVGRQQDAVDRLTAAIDAAESGSERLADLLIARSNVWKRIGEYQPAVEDLRAAREIRGDALVEDLRQLLADYREASVERIDAEGERFATLALADLDIEQGNEDAARETLRSWVENNSDDAEAIVKLLALEEKANNWESIVDLSSRLVDLQDGDERVEAALRFADACDKLERYEDARETLEMLYREMPQQAQVRQKLRELYEKTEAFQELAELLLVEAAEKEDAGERFELLKKVGELRLRDPGQVAQAIGPLAEAYSLRPDDHETTLMLVDAYIDTDMIAEAVEILQAAMEQYGGRRSKELAALQRRMAHAASKSDRVTEMQWLQAAFETYPQDMETAAELAELATQLEQYDLAVKALRSLATAKTDAPISRAQAYFKQAQIAHIQKDTRKATYLAKKALSLDSELEEARTLLEDLGAH